MTKSRTELLLSYITAVRELVNSKVAKIETKKQSTETALQFIKRQFKFNREEDWGLLCASMDLVGDTTLAIQNFERFGIEGPTKYNDWGEKYLRLYGLLNAVYLQQSAVLNLYKVFQVPNQTEFKSKIDALQITEIRHKVASHTVNYFNPTSKQRDCFVITRTELRGDKVEYMSYQTDRYVIANLTQLLGDNTELMITALSEIFEKAIRTVYKTAKAKQAVFNQELDLLRLEHAGHTVIRTHEQTITLQITKE